MLTGSVTPLEAKRLGKRVPINVGEWNARRLSVMEKVVRAKFEQNPKLRQLLLVTTEPIVEDDHWGDTYWGKYRGVGSNHLGQIHNCNVPLKRLRGTIMYVFDTSSRYNRKIVVKCEIPEDAPTELIRDVLVTKFKGDCTFFV